MTIEEFVSWLKADGKKFVVATAVLVNRKTNRRSYVKSLAYGSMIHFYDTNGKKICCYKYPRTKAAEKSANYDFILSAGTQAYIHEWLSQLTRPRA